MWSGIRTHLGDVVLQVGLHRTHTELCRPQGAQSCTVCAAIKHGTWALLDAVALTKGGLQHNLSIKCHSQAERCIALELCPIALVT